MANVHYIKVRYYSPAKDKVVESIYTTATLEYWKKEQICIDIMDYETGEMLYIKGLRE